LFSLDTRHLQAALASSRATVEQAKASVETAVIQLADAEDAANRRTSLEQRRVVSVDESRRYEFAVKLARARLTEARANQLAAEAAVQSVQVDIDRSTVLAPITGRVLQINIRPGEFATAGVGKEPLLVLGTVQPLYARVDVDEIETWKLSPDAPATASFRGNAGISTRLKYVRTEPLVRPKQSLTGDAAERVDTRVLQVIYEILDPQRFYVGQQLDVFIEDVTPRAVADNR
jgi:multidrug resistance efflux pump